MTNPSASSLSISVRPNQLSLLGMQTSWVSTTTLSVATGSCINSTGVSKIFLDTATTLNSAVVGLNGLDTGTVTASSWYYVYAIGYSLDTAQQGVLMSLSATAPVLPLLNDSSGRSYDMFRLISVWHMDSGSHFDLMYQVGNINLRQYTWDTTQSVLSNGTATTLTLVDLSAGVPPIAKVPVLMNVSFSPATAADKVSFAIPGSTSTSLSSLSSVVAAKAQIAQLKLLSDLSSSLAKVQYINSAASGSTTLSVIGFDLYL